MTSQPYSSGLISVASQREPRRRGQLGRNMPPEILFITTTDAAGNRRDDLVRLLSSIEATLAGRDWRMLLLMQCASAGQDRNVGIPANVDVEATPHKVSASHARNLVLREARGRGLLARMPLVAFPDDDCWYPEGTLERILDLFEADPVLDFLFCRYASTPQSPTSLEARLPSVFNVAASASSNTIFLRSRIVEAIGEFDEKLGLGTENNGGEDTDYALRAFRQSRKCRFVDRALVGHRDNSPQFRSRYFRGGLIAIARHATVEPASLVLLLRKVAVGGFLVATRQMPSREFRIALRAALSARAEGRRSKGRLN